jgi:hypothetical protein
VLLRYGDATEIVQVYTLNENLAGVRASLRGYIFFLNGRNRDFVKKIFPTTYLNGHPNIDIFCSGSLG